MTASHRRLRRALTVAIAALAALAVAMPSAASAAAHRRAAEAPSWQPCGLFGADCASATLPKDYSDPSAGTVTIALARHKATDPARRVGTLFLNFGGPGGTAVDRVRDTPVDQFFPGLNDRFDVVGFDPRGVGQSTPSIDCHADQEAEGVYAQPFVTPDTLDVRAIVGRDTSYIGKCLRLNGSKDILPYVSTANVARDLDRLRQAVGDAKLSYLGFSYGTFLGATYESMFPGRTRAAVLDGALDPDQYINDPLSSIDEQTAGFERAIGRFLQACAAHPTQCGFGGDDPSDAFDQLIGQLDAHPMPTSDGRALDGDDVRAAAAQSVYAKQLWPVLAAALRGVAAGQPTIMRLLADVFYGRNPDGTYDPLSDRYFTISALEQRYPHDLRTYLREGRRSYQDYAHAFWNHGYSELTWGLYPVEPRGVFRGPFRTSKSDPTTLVVGTTYDPATPYEQARRMVKQLGNARLLTMRGDGHTAYGGNSPCIDAAVEAYLEDAVVPAEGTSCRQDVPAFPAAVAAAARKRTPAARRLLERIEPHVRPAAIR
jgi:pimeloyl-ACP methyl ester carboxylesterase